MDDFKDDFSDAEEDVEIQDKPEDKPEDKDQDDNVNLEQIKSDSLSIGNWVPCSRMLLYLHHRNSKLFFHPAKFDSFKDEAISAFKTVSVSQSKNLLDWKLLV